MFARPEDSRRGRGISWWQRLLRYRARGWRKPMVDAAPIPTVPLRIAMGFVPADARHNGVPSKWYRDDARPGGRSTFSVQEQRCLRRRDPSAIFSTTAEYREPHGKNDQVMMGRSSFYYCMGNDLSIQDQSAAWSFLHLKFGRKRKLHFALRCRGRHGKGQ